LVSVLGEGDGEGDIVGLGTVDTELEFPGGCDMQPVAMKIKAANNPNASERQTSFISLLLSYSQILTSVIAIF